MDVILKLLFSSETMELYILDCLAYIMISMAFLTFVTLLFENVPYGRYASSRYGFPVNVKFAWFVQELPAFLVPLCLVFFTSASRTSHLPNQLLLCMYFCHYIQRYSMPSRHLCLKCIYIYKYCCSLCNEMMLQHQFDSEFAYSCNFFNKKNIVPFSGLSYTRF